MFFVSRLSLSKLLHGMYNISLQLFLNVLWTVSVVPNTVFVVFVVFVFRLSVSSAIAAT